MKSAGRANKNLRFALRVAWLLTRGLSLVVLALLGLLAAAYFVLPRFIDAQRVEDVLVYELQNAFRRPVQIRGVVLGVRGVKVNGLKILEKSDPGRPLLESDIVLVTIKLAPLLAGRLELKDVRLVAPRIMLARDAEGRWSFADLFSSTAAARAAPSGFLSLPLSLAAHTTQIEGGLLQIEDRLGKASVLIERFNLEVREFSADRPFAFSAAFDNLSRIGERELRATLAVEGEASLASFQWPRAFVRAESVALELDGKAVRGAGGLTGFFAGGVLDADLSLPELTPADWKRFAGREWDLSLPASRWRLRARFPGPGRVEVERLQLDAAELSLSGSGSLDRAGGEPRFTAELSLAEFPLKALGSFREGLGRRQWGGTIAGEASLSGWSGRLAVRQAEVRLRGLAATFPGLKIDRGDASLSVSDDFSRFSASVSGGSLTAYDNRLSDINASVTKAGQDLKLERLRLRWEGSLLRLKGRILNLSQPKEVSMAGTLDRLRWEKAQRLIEGFLAQASTGAAAGALAAEGTGKPWVEKFKIRIPRSFPDTMGRLRVGEVVHKNFEFKNADFLWDLRGVTPTLKKVSGDVHVGFGPGRVHDIQAVQDSNKFLRIVFLPYIYMHKMNSLSVLSAAAAYPKTLDFNRIEGQYGVAQGLVTTRFFHVDSPQLVAYADGSADFGRETVDMSILTRLTSYRAPLPQWWVDETGRPAIGFRVTGNLNQPDLEPRLRKIASDEIEKALEEGRRRAKARFEAVEKLQTL